MNRQRAVVLVYEGRLGSARADSTYVLENAEIFSQFCKTQIVVSRRTNWTIPQHIKNRYEIIELGKPFDPKTTLQSVIGQLRFSFHLKRLLANSDTNSRFFLIFHDWWPAQLIRFLQKRKQWCVICLEVHNQIPLSLPKRLLFRNIDLFVATNSIKFKEIKKYFGDKVTFEPNAVRLSRYLDAESCRQKVQNQILIGYTGSLGIDKNPELFVELLKKRIDVAFAVAGNVPSKVKTEIETLDNVTLLGPLDREKIPSFQISCDALLVTLNPKTEVSSRYTSTMKLFEYIAARKPILAPLLESTLDILDTSEFYGYEAGSLSSASNALDALIGDLNKGVCRLPRLERIRQYSWQERNRRILRALESISNFHS